MPNETDKQELSEEILKKWEDHHSPIVVTLINALRATRQELAASEKELEICKGSGKVAHEHIAQLEHQVGARDLVINSARMGEEESQRCITELQGYLDNIATVFLKKTNPGFTYTPQTLARGIGEKINELEQQLVNSKWLRHELNAYYLGYPTSEQEVLEHEKVRAMSDADFLDSIKAQNFKEKEQARHDRERIEECVEALQAVVNYFWGEVSPILREGDVQSLVESSIKNATLANYQRPPTPSRRS